MASQTAAIPGMAQRLLGFKIAQVIPLDSSGNPIRKSNGFSVASGFLRQEPGGLFLYTCWHVISGHINPHDLRIPPSGKWVKPAALQVRIQEPVEVQQGTTRIGGNQELVIPLYDTNGIPLYLQHPEDVPHEDLNRAGLRLPALLDCVKLPISNLSVSPLQTFGSACLLPRAPPLPGDRVLIAGYPYGYSVDGPNQPSPVILTRFLASPMLERGRFLTDGSCAPGMSGGPVLLPQDDDLLLMGIYTGEIYPDYGHDRISEVTALGAFDDLSFALMRADFLVRPPLISGPVERTE